MNAINVEAAKPSQARLQYQLGFASDDHSPFDVVAWRGNHAPCKYDMARFMVLGAVAFDHAEPSVYCGLSSPSDAVAGPNADFMILPPRWLVAGGTGTDLQRRLLVELV